MIKKITLCLSAFAVILMFATGCKKDSKSAQELILGKWNYVLNEWHEKDGTDEDSDSEDVSSYGWYFEFKSNGKVNMHWYGGDEEMDYTIKDNETLIIDGELVPISKLNDKEMTFYFKETDTDYLYEEWYHFKK